MRNKSNDYGIERSVQRRETYTGVKGTAEQDIMIQQSQGLVADRTRENLPATDAAIVRFRRLLIESARDLFERGVEPRRPISTKLIARVPVLGSPLAIRNLKKFWSSGLAMRVDW